MSLHAFTKGEHFIARQKDKSTLYLTALEDRPGIGYAALKCKITGTTTELTINTNFWDIERIVPEIPVYDGIYEFIFTKETVTAVLFSGKWYLSTRSGHEEMEIALALKENLRGVRRLLDFGPEE